MEAAAEGGAIADITIGAVLAGGESRRFGSPKGLARLGGRPIIERVVAAHLEVLPEVVLVVATVPSPFEHLGIPLITDRSAGSGPLAGVHAALQHAVERGAGGVCCTSCDTPFLSEYLLRSLLRASVGVDAVVPEGPEPGRLQPLFSWYSTRVLPEVERSLAGGDHAMHGLVRRIGRCRVLGPADLDLEQEEVYRLFHNVNTPDDLVIAERMLSSLPPKDRMTDGG